VNRFLLIRHAAIDGLGRRIAGRAPGLGLNPAGRDQAERLAGRLVPKTIHAVYASPQQRAIETAEPIARALGLPMQIAAELDEIDFGDWTGKSYEELALLPEWRAFNLLHSSMRIPNGELLLEAQGRVVGFMGRLSERDRERTVALVSHGDVIRVALAHHLGIPIDFIMRFEIAPASVSAVEIHTEGPRVLWLNNLAEQI